MQNLHSGMLRADDFKKNPCTNHNYTDSTFNLPPYLFHSQIGKAVLITRMSTVRGKHERKKGAILGEHTPFFKTDTVISRALLL